MVKSQGYNCTIGLEQEIRNSMKTGHFPELYGEDSAYSWPPLNPHNELPT